MNGWLIGLIPLILIALIVYVNLKERARRKAMTEEERKRDDEEARAEMQGWSN
jgi:cytochrome c-type biogenesis protein CcmH/NrfF